MTKSKEIITPRTLINVLLQRMKLGGHSPLYQNIYTKIYSYTTLFLFFVSWILQNIYIFTTKYEDFGVLIIDLVIIAAVWQIFTKCVAIHMKKKEILHLRDIVYNRFWTDDMLTEVERIESQEIYRYTSLITKIYTLSIYLTQFGHAITAVLRGNHNLIMNTWLPEPIKETLFSTPYFEILVLFQFYLMPWSTVTGLLPMDNLYVTSIAVILAQLRMLESKLLSLGNDGNIANDSKLMIKCIDHHNLIFEAIATVETIFSGLVLHIFATNIMLGVITLLGLLIEDNVTQLVEFGFILVSVYGQLYIYCQLGQFIQDETLSVADAAYNCKWEDIEDRSLKMSILMTIQRSQKSARLTLGGMLILSLENFTRIARLMLSMLTLMVNMKDED